MNQFNRALSDTSRQLRITTDTRSSSELRLHIPDPAIPDPQDPDRPCLGIFDSGIGGISVLRALHRQAPAIPTLYLADQAHAPYGEKPQSELISIARGIVAEMIRHQAIAVVLACNTASAAALHELRRAFPGQPIIGMEPAVKPAAERSRSGRIGILATAVTLQGQPYAGVLARFASHLEVHTLTCPEFVQLVEAGEIASEPARAIVTEKLRPLLARGIDQLVLGCTHYSFLLPLIEQACAGRAAVIDPADAVARQAIRIWQRLAPPRIASSDRLVTTDPAARPRLATTSRDWLGPVPTAAIEVARWLPQTEDGPPLYQGLSMS